MNQTNNTQPTRSVGFSWHAMDRVTNRLSAVIDYATVQTVLATKALPKAGEQTVIITTLDKTVRVADPELLNGYAQGNTIVAHVQMTDGGLGVWVKTVKLVDNHSKYR